MIYGVGTDIVDVERIKRSVERNDRFKSMVYSEAEVKYCEKNKPNYQSYAGKYAAKEAFMKAVGTGWRGELAFNEIEILNDEMGKPFINIVGKSKQELTDIGSWHIHLSVSHTSKQAVAFCVIEKQHN